MEAIEVACHSAGLLFVRYPVNAMNFPGADLDGLGRCSTIPIRSCSHIVARVRAAPICGWRHERRRIWRVLYKQPETSVLT